MSQGLLPFKYELEKREGGLTALGGVGLYLDLFRVLKLGHILDSNIGIRDSDQGYMDRHIGLLLILLNIVGGDCVEDLERLEQDDGFCRLWEKLERRGKLVKRFRRKLQRKLPSASTVFRYLEAFHQEAPREQGKAIIPESNSHLCGFVKANRKLIAKVQRLKVEKTATLDGDATVAETWKESALYTYQGGKGYQPMNVFWREMEMLLHTEFRDGNVPANHDVLRIFREALALLPAGVSEVLYRSDCASYQHDLLGYMDDERKTDRLKERFGRIGFAVSCPVSEAYKTAVYEVAETEWLPLDMDKTGKPITGGREWAEVCFVPSAIGHKKWGREYRYFATRQELAERLLPGMEEQLEFPFPVLKMKQKRYKVFGVVSNLNWAGGKMIGWHDERCGKSEEAHAILKNDLAGGKFPSGKFGANAAWWWYAVLAFNMQSVMKRFVLDAHWRNKRMKAIRFHLIHLPARVLLHANRLIIRVATGADTYAALLRARARMMTMTRAPASG